MVERRPPPPLSAVRTVPCASRRLAQPDHRVVPLGNLQGRAKLLVDPSKGFRSTEHGPVGAPPSAYEELVLWGAEPAYVGAEGVEHLRRPRGFPVKVAIWGSETCWVRLSNGEGLRSELVEAKRSWLVTRPPRDEV